jgi:hypothetical protein
MFRFWEQITVPGKQSEIGFALGTKVSGANLEYFHQEVFNARMLLAAIESEVLRYWDDAAAKTNRGRLRRFHWAFYISCLSFF